MWIVVHINDLMFLHLMSPDETLLFIWALERHFDKKAIQQNNSRIHYIFIVMLCDVDSKKLLVYTGPWKPFQKRRCNQTKWEMVCGQICEQYDLRARTGPVVPRIIIHV